GDPAAIEHRRGVVELAVLQPRRSDQHRRAAVGGLARELLDLAPAGGLQRRLEYQVLGWISGQVKFGKYDEIGAVTARRGARAARLRSVAGDVADGRIELC